MRYFCHPDELLTVCESEYFHIYLLDMVMPMLSGTAVISIEPVKYEKLSEAQKISVPADAAIVDKNVLVNDTRVHDFNGGKIIVSVPYTLKDGEDPDSVTVWYLEDDGSLTPMSVEYDPASGTEVFTTTNLSRYVIGSFPFTDVPDDAYYFIAVVWATEKGITEGMGDKAFSPADPCTRAHIVTFLWRYLGK